MILTREEILKEIKRGNIKLTPFRRSLFGPASYDLELGGSLRIFKKRQKPFLVHNEIDFKKITKLVRIQKSGYELKPGEAVLGITKERIFLAPNIAGWLEGRSRFARIGLMVHISAPFMHPGINNHQVLEIANLSPTPVIISAGLRICQFVFERCEGKAVYKGRFKEQVAP